jgi:uncharacterized membrane protein YphA (DoxX/SURF4 family)
MENQPRIVNLQLTDSTGPVGVALLLNRLALGFMFLLAGIGKLKMGPAAFYRDVFLAVRPPWLPEILAKPYGYALPFLEALVGALLIIGLLSRVTAGVMALMLASFTIALWAAGMFFQGGGPFHTNVILLTLAILLATMGPGRYSLDYLIRRGKVARAKSVRSATSQS